VAVPEGDYCGWREWYLRPTIHAYYEMADLGFDLYDVLSILEMGYDCSRGRRASGTIERCIKKGKKEYRVVVVESYSYDSAESALEDRDSANIVKL